METEEALAILTDWGIQTPKALTYRGKTLWARELTTAEMDARLQVNKYDWQQGLPITVGASAIICDDQGKLLLDPHNEQHVALVGKVPWSQTSKLTAAIEAKEDEPQGN